MEENIKDNKNLITVLVALIILIVVAVFYWDRQKQLYLRQAQAEMQTDLLEEWGPQAQQQVQAAFGAQTVAFSRQVSYKNIIVRVAPSTVSINVNSGFFNQGGPAVQSQPVAQTKPADQSQEAAASAQYVWGGTPGIYPVPSQSQQIAAQNRLADQSQEASGLGQYVWGGRMGGWGLGPGGYLVCPNCGKGMGGWGMGTGGNLVAQPTAAQQQATPQQKDNQFQAQGRGGSGVIVNRLGYVLTNHHVVHGARTITVTLSSGQISKNYPAQLIDEAPDLDFAILKIVANGNEQFTAAPIGNSSIVSVGDEVLAIGSPFGLQQSVTFGIVSNTQRSLTVGRKTFTNFIQTDAPINPGSSGGPLMNVKGEVIGINTAIYSPTQAFSGIGFASPIDPAKSAFPEFIEATPNVAGVLRRNIPNWARGPALKQVAQIQRGLGLSPWCPPGGRLRQAANIANRPWLGIRVRGVDREIRSFVGLPMSRGVLVMEVFDSSPCRAAGLQRGDVIIRVDNRAIKDEAMLGALLFKKRAGDKMKLTIYRDGKKMNLSPRLSVSPVGLQGAAAGLWPEAPEWPGAQRAVLQAQAVALAAQPSTPFNPENVQPPGLSGVLQGGEVETGAIEALGMELGELSPELALAYGVPKGVTGLIVVESAAQAAATGLLADDVIEAVNGQRVETIVDFIKAMNNASLRDGISLDVYRQGQRVSLTMRG